MRPELVGDETDMLFDRFGFARLRVLNDTRIVTMFGDHMGFIAAGAVYNYRGKHIGWYEGGVFRDVKGSTVAYGVHPTDRPAPYFPYHRLLLARGPIKTLPRFPYIVPTTFKPIKQYGWSDKDPIGVFVDG